MLLSDISKYKKIANTNLKTDFGKFTPIGGLVDADRRRIINKNSIFNKSDINRGIKYYVKPDNSDFKFDLNKGFDPNSYVLKNPFDGGIDDLLEWIINNKRCLTGIDLVCWRGILTSLMTCIFDKYANFRFYVIKYKNIWYFCQAELQKDKLFRQNADELAKKQTYQGLNFETYLTSFINPYGTKNREVDKVLIKKEMKNSVGNFEDEGYFALVSSRKLIEDIIDERSYSTNILFASEIDCCELNNSEPVKYIELKTSMQGKPLHDIKKMKWWAQSYLAGVDKIIIGEKDTEGFVSNIYELEVDNLFNNSTWWDPIKCKSFLNKSIRFIKEQVSDEGKVYAVFRNENNIVCEITDDKFNFIPDWYKSFI